MGENERLEKKEGAQLRVMCAALRRKGEVRGGKKKKKNERKARREPRGNPAWRTISHWTFLAAPCDIAAKSDNLIAADDILFKKRDDRMIWCLYNCSCRPAKSRPLFST